MRLLALLTLTVTALGAPSLDAQAPGEAAALETRVWLDRGDEPVLRRGETVRIFYRATENAYAAIFRIDTDGRISLIYPQDPTMEERLTAGVDYRLIFPNSPVWRVNDDPGVGYFFMVASEERLDFSAFPFDPDFGWDLTGVSDAVYEDPYIAIDQYVALLIPAWEVASYALDFVTYSVGDTYTYPRFLCYDCHDAQPYSSWNPYAIPCTTYRVVIYDDPYFYPYYRYSGTSVVVSRPLVTQPRYAVAARAAGDSYRPLIRSRTPPPRRTTAEFKEAAEAGPTGVSPRALTPQRQPTGRPTLQRRPATPSTRLPVRTPPSASGTRATPTPGRGTPDPTIVRPGRQSTPTASPTPQPATRPSGRVTPTPRGGTAPSARPSTRPTTRPSASPRPSARPSTTPRPSTRPSASTRPGTASTRPSRPSTRAPASSRPTTRPAPSRPPTRSPTTPRSTPTRPNNPPAARSPSRQPSAPSRPSAGSAPSRSPAPSRPSGSPRPRGRPGN